MCEIVRHLSKAGSRQLAPTVCYLPVLPCRQHRPSCHASLAYQAVQVDQVDLQGTERDNERWVKFGVQEAKSDSRLKVNSCRLISCALNLPADRRQAGSTATPTPAPLFSCLSWPVASLQVGFFVCFLRSFPATCANSFSWKMTFAAFCARQEPKEPKEPKDNGAQNIYNHFGCYYFSAVENFIPPPPPPPSKMKQTTEREHLPSLAASSLDAFQLFRMQFYGA